MQPCDIQDDRAHDSLRSRLVGTAMDRRHLGRYRLLDVCGSGGMGAVFKAMDDRLERAVAIKVLYLSSDEGELLNPDPLMREARALAKFSHPNLVQVHDVGEEGGLVYMAMEFVEGSTLEHWLVARERPWAEVRCRFLGAGQGLAAAHRKGLIHRDFKPSNVLLDEDGRARVADFGLVSPSHAGSTRSRGTGRARITRAWSADTVRLGPSHTRSSAHAQGTVAFMSPEQLRGRRLDERSDQFSFCVALYLGCYGHMPFPGDTVVARAQAVEDGQIRKPSRRRVPRYVYRALVRGLSADPERRFPSMSDLLRAVEGPRWLPF